MKYQEALEYINEKNKLGSRLGLDSITKLLELLGNPQNKLKCIHIGGTNGKGSTSSYLSYALESAGYKVGLFTSPHLNKINESIQINHQEISDEIFGRLIGLIKEKADIMVEEGLFHPTTFEIITALCFLYFVEEDVDICILEVGLGGRNDSTNVISSSLASVISTIDYDHIDILGSTLSEIAYEKAGIIKNNSIVVSYPQKKEAIEVIEKVTKEKNADFHICPMENVIVKDVNNNGSKFDFSFEDMYLKDINISMLGEHQIYNASLALTTLLILRNKGMIEIAEKQLREGLMEARLPGRLEVLKNNPTLLIDGAHNVQGITQLKKAISLFKYNRLILCIGILKDKDTSHMVELLAPLADEIIVTEVNSPRRLAAEALAKEIYKYNKNIIIEKDAKKVIQKALEFAEQDDLILFAGSLYLIGEIRSLFKLL